MRKSWLWGAAAVAGLIGSVAAAQRAAPVYPPFGFDLTSPDRKVQPGDDFFQYANGAYLAYLRDPDGNKLVAVARPAS